MTCQWIPAGQNGNIFLPDGWSHLSMFEDEGRLGSQPVNSQIFNYMFNVYTRYNGVSNCCMRLDIQCAECCAVSEPH